MDYWRKSNKVFLSFGIPPTIWLFAFFLGPLFLVWGLSFGEKQGIIRVAITGTLENYLRALQPLYLQIFLKSFWYAGLTTFFCLVISFPVALAITFVSDRWKPILLLLIILPFWTNLLIRTYALIAVLRTNGYLNDLLELIWQSADSGLRILGLGDWNLLGERFHRFELLYNNFAVVYGLVYVHLPFMVLPLYAALDRMDRSYIEVSLDLGASQWRTFLSVIVPLALPGIISGVIITFIPALGTYLTPDLLGGTDSQMIANVIERQFKSANDWPFGAALSFLLMYLTFFALSVRALLTNHDEKGLA